MTAHDALAAARKAVPECGYLRSRGVASRCSTGEEVNHPFVCDLHAAIAAALTEWGRRCAEESLERAARVACANCRAYGVPLSRTGFDGDDIDHECDAEWCLREFPEEHELFFFHDGGGVEIGCDAWRIRALKDARAEGEE